MSVLGGRLSCVIHLILAAVPIDTLDSCNASVTSFVY